MGAEQEAGSLFMGEIERQNPASPKRKRGPRAAHKWIKRITLGLILGMLINIAIAWACAAWSPVKWTTLNSMDEFDNATSAQWATIKRFRAMGEVSPYDKNSGIGTKTVIARVIVIGSDNYTHSVIRNQASGFPFLSLSSEWWMDVKQNAPEPPKAKLGIVIDRHGKCLPMSPVLPGFLWNTVIYGTMTLPLTLIPTAFRRHRRARKGLCTSCGYDIAGLATCPECGNQSKAPKP